MVSNEYFASDLNGSLPERHPAKSCPEKHLLEKKGAAQETSILDIIGSVFLKVPQVIQAHQEVGVLVDLLIPVHPWLASGASAQGSPVHMACCQLPTITLINTKKGQLSTCSSPYARPSPRPDNPESSTCDKF